jgi:hypothetical protein
MPPYAARCSWCGRSTTVSAFLQVLSITVVVVGALVIAGVVPMSTVRKYVPGLGSGTEAGVVASVDQPPPADVSPDAPGSPAAPRTAQAAEPPSPRAAEASSRRAAASGGVAGPVTQALSDSGAGCDAPSRVDALAARHPDWARESAVLVSCGKIALGFTSDQVIAAKGRPRQIERPQGASLVEDWVYRALGVVLELGRVVSVRQ